LLPGGSPPLRALSLLHINDKIQHFLAYFVLAWFPAWLDSRKAAAVTCLGLVAMGAALELLQLLVPGRSCELFDAFADLAGVICGALAAAVSRILMMRTGVSPGTPA